MLIWNKIITFKIDQNLFKHLIMTKSIKHPQQTISLGNFNYGSLQSLMTFFSVPVSAIKPLLKGTGLVPGLFEGKALVNLNFERYAGFGGNYSSYVNEVEFNVVAYPAFRQGTEPALSVAEYLNGDDQSKTYGNYRINVPCDSETAVVAGSKKYGEVKFVASFDFAVPDVNAPEITTWWIRCYPSVQAPKSQTPFIFDLKVDTTGPNFPASATSPFSPVPAYANLKETKGQDKGKKFMITSSRVIFGLFKSWYDSSASTPINPLPKNSVELVIGTAKHTMQREMSSVFKGDPVAVGVLLYNSPPAASSGHTRLTDPIR
jgi:hypothetical protein